MGSFNDNNRHLVNNNNMISLYVIGCSNLMLVQLVYHYFETDCVMEKTHIVLYIYKTMFFFYRGAINNTRIYRCIVYRTADPYKCVFQDSYAKVCEWHM